jgi:hypothetical protein
MPLGVKYGRYPPSHRTKSKKIEHFVSVPGGAVDRCHHHPLPNRRLVLHRLLRGRRLGDRRVACRADIFPYLSASARRVAIYLATYRGVATSCCPCNLPPLSAGGVWRSDGRQPPRTTDCKSGESKCPLWVIRDQAIQRQCRTMVAVTPIATKPRTTRCARSIHSSVIALAWTTPPR